MQIKLKSKFDYNKTMVTLSVLTVLSALGCSLLGYVFLPFAAAFYAALLIYEEPVKRLVSYLLPVVIFALNFMLRGVYSIEALAYVGLGFIIFIAFVGGMRKGEAVFWAVAAVIFMFIVSAILLSFEKVGVSGFSTVKYYYSSLYMSSKKEFVDFAMSLVTTNSEGVTVYAYTLYEAEILFENLIIILIALAIIYAFVTVGVTCKILSAILRKCSVENSSVSKWSFFASNPFAYLYIIVAVLSVFVSQSGGVFSFSVTVLNTVLSVVFAYVGFKAVRSFIASHGRGGRTAIIIVLLVLLLFTSFFVSVLSYIGVYYSISRNKHAPPEKEQS